MVNLNDTPLFRKINSFPQEQREKVLNDQGVWPLWPGREGLKSRQRLANFHKLELARELSCTLEAEGITHAFLKGVTFLGTLYHDFSQRFMSDVDIYIPKRQRTKALEAALISLGYKRRDSFVWLGNGHKEEWVHLQSQVVLELHFQLFWHLDSTEGQLNFLQPEKQQELRVLEPELHFIYLCGHYCFQHTCQKLYWLIDLELFLSLHNLDWDKLKEYAFEMRLQKSLSFVMKLLFIGFERKSLLSQAPAVFPVDEDVFFCDSLSPYNFLLKSYLKDSRWDEIKYNIFWLNNLLTTKVLSKKSLKASYLE